MTKTLAVRSLSEAEHPNVLAIARECLKEVKSLPEITELLDKAEVVRLLARKVGLSQDACLDWEEYKLDAERKMGEELKRMADAGERLAKGKGGIKVKGIHGAVSPSNPLVQGSNHPPTLAQLDIKESKAYECLAIADIPQNQYDQFKKEAREEKQQITTNKAVQLAKKIRKAKAPKPATPDIADYARDLAKKLLKKLDKLMEIEELTKLAQYRQHIPEDARQELAGTLEHIALVATKHAKEMR